MLHCWKVLVPMKAMTGFDDAISSREKLVWRREMITKDRTLQVGATPDISKIVPDG
jgi:hypothetical protein